MGTDRPHVLRQAIHCCRNFGTVSVVGVDGGFLDKIPMGSAINRGLTFRMAQTPVQHYLGIEKGEIDPSFVITHRAKDYGELAKLQAMGYRNPSQKIATMFHMGEDLLATLNPGVDLSKAGTKILVADVKPQPIHGTLKTIVVEKSQVLGYDRKGHVLVAYPATIGSRELPSPSGT